MLILGIETSCDETAVAIVKNGKEVISNIIASSIDLHQETGGVVPEIAARDSANKIISVVNKALEEAEIIWQDIDAIAVANGPGLPGSLMVGIETARVLAFVHKKPLIPVYHIMGHIYSNILDRGVPNFPVLVLTVSGGHNNLLIWKDFLDFEILGETLDDAGGEAFDKVAKMLDLGFPGGPIVSKLAEKGDRQKYKFPRPMAQSNDFNFSYSGLKTAVLYTLRDEGEITENVKADVCASFEEAIVDSLLIKLKKAVKKYKPTEIHLAGGVSANKRLQEVVGDYCEKNKIKFLKPAKMIYSTDNGAMVASAGYFIYKKSPTKNWRFEDVKLKLDYSF